MLGLNADVLGQLPCREHTGGTPWQGCAQLSRKGKVAVKRGAVAWQHRVLLALPPLVLPSSPQFCTGAVCPLGSDSWGFTLSQNEAHVTGLNPMFEHIFLFVTLKLSLSRPDVHVGPSGSAAPGRTIAFLQKAFHPGYSPCFSELQPDKLKCALQLSLPAHPACPACEEVGWF